MEARSFLTITDAHGVYVVRKCGLKDGGKGRCPECVLTCTPDGRRIAVTYGNNIIPSQTPGTFILEDKHGRFCYDRNCRIAGEDCPGTDLYDEKLRSIPHYQRYPQIIPFVGKQYSSRNRKLLILAESHYPPYASDGASWYAGSAGELSCEDHLWTNTAMITNNAGQNSQPGQLYSAMQYAINPTGDYHKDILTKVAFMNFFQRPAAAPGASIVVTPQDRQVANETLLQVIEVLKPDCFFFISKKAYESVDKDIFGHKPVGQSPHPLCSWWNTASAKYSDLKGKEVFVKFIRDNKIF